MAQYRVIAYAGNHGSHQLINEFTGGREGIDANTGFGLLIKHNVVQVIAIVPQAELCAHAIVADRRTKHFRNRGAERRHHFLQTDDFLCQLRFILFGRKVFGVMMYPE